MPSQVPAVTRVTAGGSHAERACSDQRGWKINNSAAALHQARLLQQMARSALLQISSPFSPFFTLRLAFRESILPALFINSLGLMEDAAFCGNTDERK